VKDTRQPHIIDQGRSFPTQEKQTTAWELPDSNAEVQAKGANNVAQVEEGGEKNSTEPAPRVTQDDTTPLPRESESNLEEPPRRNSFEAAELDELNTHGSQSGGISSITALSVRSAMPISESRADYSKVDSQTDRDIDTDSAMGDSSV
jgi:hypothetical protein